VYKAGQWRIVHINLFQIEKAYGKDEPIFGKDYIGPGKNIAVGVNAALKFPEYSELLKLGIIADIPLFPYVDIVPGVNYCFLDSPHSDDDYMEIYALLKAGYTFYFHSDPDAPAFFIHPYIAGGGGIDFTFIGGANIPAILQGGIEFGYDRFALAIACTYSSQILGNMGDYWNSLATYDFPHFGMFIKYYF
jgi:hypothetical protein